MVTFHPTATALEVRHQHEILTIEAWGTDSVRIRAAQYRIPSDSHGALDVAPAADPPAIDVRDGSARVVHGELTVDVAFDRDAAYPEPLLTFSRTSTGAQLLAPYGRAGMAEQVALPRPGGAARRRPGVSAPRAPAVGHRDRLLPPVHNGRLPLRPHRVAGPQAMVAELAEMDVELMVSVWPTVSPLAENFAEFRDRGPLVGSDQGVEYHQTIQDKGMAAPMPVTFYDRTSTHGTTPGWSPREWPVPGGNRPCC